MYGLCGDAAHPENRGEQVRSRAQVLDGPKKLHTVALFLQRIIGCGGSLHRNFFRLQLKRLFCLGCQHQPAFHDQRRTDILVVDLIVVGELLPCEHDLQGFEAAAVVQFDEAEVFLAADGARPAADGDRRFRKDGCIVIDCCNFYSFHSLLSP